jgi:hypothetical protein
MEFKALCAQRPPNQPTAPAAAHPTNTGHLSAEAGKDFMPTC